MQFIKLMASNIGRGLRALVGLIFLITGAAAGGGWFALSAVGLILIAVGVFDVCLFAPLFGMPIRGSKIRS